MKKEIYAIVQARIGSKRFRGKVLKKIKGEEAILILLNRLSRSKKIKKIIVAIPKSSENKKLKRLLIKNNYSIFEGSQNNVLNRYYECAKKFSAQHILRITGDCPLVDPQLVDKAIKIYNQKKYDYVSNIENRSYPDGMDVEIFSFKVLNKANKLNLSTSDKEHVTNYFLRSDKIKKKNFSQEKDFSNIRITLDTKYDYILIKKIFNHFKNFRFNLSDLMNFYFKNKKTFIELKKMSEQINSTRLTKGQKTWELAKEYIAGGNMLFSKRPDAFLPGKWPSYFRKAKGCEIWDLDNKKYYDMSIMGIGTSILGYSNPQVDTAVKKRLSKGNMSTLNCLEEVNLSKKLIEMHDWADQVRLARSGGEANAIAVRLARAYTNKTKIAFCGYHGWHDWYLAANLRNNKNLNSHLLPSLKTAGVYKNLKGSIFPFNYNDFKTLKNLVNKNKDIGIIKMEVMRSELPKNNFLKKVRKLADDKNIVLIFDECTSGFRECLGGIHKKFGVNPDVLMLGKALGNGYAITAVLGKKKIMNSIKKTFISSTFWTESIGPTAALKTIEIMEKKKSWKYITNLGVYIKKNWIKLAKKHKLKIKVQGISALCTFNFKSKYHQAYRTYITQEMLKKNFLATNMIYVSIAHNKKIIDQYLSHLDRIFSIISKCEKGDDIFKYLETKVSETDFARLN